MAGYIPRPDSEFDEWIQNFVKRLKQHGPALGIPANLITDIETMLQSWLTDYQGHLAAQDDARGACETKDHTKDDIEKAARTLTKMLQANPATTDGQRQQFRITVADTTPTPQSPDYVLGITPPLMDADFSQRQQITAHFGTNPGNERENAKPDGIAGAKLWFRLIEPQGRDAKTKSMSKFLQSLDYQEWGEWNFLADDTNSPYVHIIETTIPITLEYKAQWFDNSMRLGPLGDPVRVTVTP